MHRFRQLREANDLHLDYTLNADGLSILDAIFRLREYADYFPFYEDATIVDVGAHYGYFSLFAAANLGPQGSVYAIEPSPASFAILRNNLRDNKADNVLPHELALAGRSDKQQLYLGRAENNSLLEDYELLDGSGAKTEVKALTLEDFMTEQNIEFIDFLKLDCEGAEYDILETASEEVLSRVTTISLEFHDLKSAEHKGASIVRLLGEHGYRIVKFTHEPTMRNLNYGKIVATRD